MQRQKAGKKAVAVQSARDTYVQVGISSEDMYKMLEELGRQQVAAYTAVAERIVAERLGDFAERLIKVFFRRGESRNPGLSGP